MKSGTQSKLMLVDRNGREITVQPDEEEMSVEYVAGRNDEAPARFRITSEKSRQSQLMVFAAVSTGCAAAAIVTGSYALWLSRRKMADDALTSVHDILKTCQDRVTQIEEELNHLPTHQSSSASNVV